MAKQNWPRSDKERLESIKEVQKLSKTFDQVDVGKIVSEAVGDYWTEREVAWGLIGVILNKAHSTDGWIKRFKLEKTTKSLEEKMNHVRTCSKCLLIMAHAKNAIEYILTVPKAVTLQGGEKATRYLARKNKMTEAEFKEWLDKTGQSILKEMNEDI